MRKQLIIVLVAVFVLSACAPVHQNIQPRVVTPAEQIPNQQSHSGLVVAAETYNYPGQGLNYRQAGIHPVRVTVTNRGVAPVLVSPAQVLAYGSDMRLYMTYTDQEAVQLVINSQAMEEAAKGAAAGAVTGAAIGALVGLAVGAIFRVDVGRTAAVGAVAGGLHGSAGGVAGYLVQLRNAAIAEITTNALRQTVVYPGFTVSGWMYFPGHVALTEVRLALTEMGSGQIRAFRIPMPMQAWMR